MKSDFKHVIPDMGSDNGDTVTTTGKMVTATFTSRTKDEEIERLRYANESKDKTIAKQNVYIYLLLAFSSSCIAIILWSVK